MNVAFRLCSPTETRHTGQVNGMSEFFAPEHFEGGPMAVMICSPWVDADPFGRLIELLAPSKAEGHVVYLLTMLAHAPDYWDHAVAPALHTLAQGLGCGVEVRVLPVPNAQGNRAGISDEALHAKMYLLAERPTKRPQFSEQALSGLQPAHLKEAFFGSANFTGKGQHCGNRASNHKWEVVARATDSDGRAEVLHAFTSLWKSAYRMGKEHPQFHRDWRWPLRPLA